MNKSIFAKDGTAQGVAKQRLIETLARPDKRIINDPYADMFVIGASFIKLMGHKLSVWLTRKVTPGLHEHLISRTRFIDDLIKKVRLVGQSNTSSWERGTTRGLIGLNFRLH